jgi:hypothetical protein
MLALDLRHLAGVDGHRCVTIVSSGRQDKNALEAGLQKHVVPRL